MARVVRGAKKGQVASYSIMKQIVKHVKKLKKRIILNLRMLSTLLITRHKIILIHYSPVQLVPLNPTQDILSIFFM